jgi:hypothetical protein
MTRPALLPSLWYLAGPSTAALLAQAKDVKKACANNWAAVELKRKNWPEAASQASKVCTVVVLPKAQQEYKP